MAQTATKTASIDNTTVTVNVPMKIKWADVADLLCSAFEGGSNFWYMIEEFREPSGPAAHWPVRTDRERVFRHLDYPVNPGGGLVVSDGKLSKVERQGKKTLINRESLTDALALYASQYPESFARFQSQDYDANDGDLFLQLAVFGKVIYG